MRRKPSTLVLFALSLTLASGASAMQILEGFESPSWPTASWTSVESPLGVPSAAAAHDGSQGMPSTSGWCYNTSVSIGMPGDRLSMWTRFAAGANASLYLGFDADAGGCFSLRLSNLSGDIRFQENPGYGFVQLNSSPFSPVPNTWYRIEVEFRSTTEVVGRVYNANGVSIAAVVEQTLAAPLGPGGISCRAVGSGGSIDTIGWYRPGMADDGCAQVVEDWDAVGWPWSPWTTAFGTSGTTSIVADHDGSGGYLGDSGWEVNENVLTGVPGTRISMWTRHDSSAGAATRSYLGFAAGTTGCRSLTLAADTGQLIIQTWSAWTPGDLAMTNYSFQADRWYRLEVEFVDPSAVRGRVYDSDGVTELASVLYHFPFNYGTGGIAVRSDVSGRMHVDTLELLGPPVLEDFESTSWPSGNWVTRGGGVSGATSTSAARVGSRGYLSPSGLSGWEVNTTLQAGDPGDVLSMWARGNGSAQLGFGATTTGAYSFVFDEPGSRILFTDSSGWGSTELNAIGVTVVPSSWHRMEVEFPDAFTAIGRLYGPDSSTAIGTLFQSLPPGLVPGGIAIRGQTSMHIDQLENWTPGETCGSCPTFCGDCNGNMVGPDITDALRAAQLAAGLFVPTPTELSCCDVDSSGAVAVLDALGIAQVAAGLPVTLTCP